MCRVSTAMRRCPHTSPHTRYICRPPANPEVDACLLSPYSPAREPARSSSSHPTALSLRLCAHHSWARLRRCVPLPPLPLHHICTTHMRLPSLSGPRPVTVATYHNGERHIKSRPRRMSQPAGVALPSSTNSISTDRASTSPAGAFWRAHVSTCARVTRSDYREVMYVCGRYARTMLYAHRRPSSRCMYVAHVMSMAVARRCC
mmetsp:Transcript_23947/g.47870  ORF Transcript_23947/g.47870 Transcript_23947/m.47870 type:complete len:203 (+) Transcript_23947:127-735(+)